MFSIATDVLDFLFNLLYLNGIKINISSVFKKIIGHIALSLRLTGELSVLIGEKIDYGLASLRSPISL